jgi:hypothetical protein
MNSTINTHFLSIPEDICHLLSIFGFCAECVCIDCFDCSLVSTIISETQVSSFVTHTMRLKNSSSSVWYRCKKVKAEAILCSLCAPVSICWNTSCSELVIALPNYDDLVENSAWNLWKFARILSNCEAPPSFTHFLVNILNKIISHYRWLATSLFIVNICSRIFEHSSPLLYSSFAR